MDPYKRPALVYVRTRLPVKDGKGRRGRLILPDGTALHGIEDDASEARPLPPGQCYGVTKAKGNGNPCIWLHWGDPDGSDEHQIHVGNTLADIHGCIAVGLSAGPDGTVDSRKAMDALYKAIGAGSYEAPKYDVFVTLTIVEV